MAIISKPPTGKGKQRGRKKGGGTGTASKKTKTKFVMVTFGRDNAAVVEEFEKKAAELDWSHAALAREMIRKCLGYSSHLP